MGKELTNNEMAKIILANLNELKEKELSSGIYFKSVGRKYVTIISKINIVLKRSFAQPHYHLLILGHSKNWSNKNISLVKAMVI